MRHVDLRANATFLHVISRIDGLSCWSKSGFRNEKSTQSDGLGGGEAGEAGVVRGLRWLAWIGTTAAGLLLLLSLINISEPTRL
ncbi:hypothetical protein, partial [Methylobacterium platani]|uniref:hypothetical protein n=1 Tax=Methylobacterium platani TaxID=427683 RepID=UPI001AE0375B